MRELTSVTRRNPKPWRLDIKTGNPSRDPRIINPSLITKGSQNRAISVQRKVPNRKSSATIAKVTGILARIVPQSERTRTRTTPRRLGKRRKQKQRRRKQKRRQ